MITNITMTSAGQTEKSSQTSAWSDLELIMGEVKIAHYNHHIKMVY